MAAATRTRTRKTTARPDAYTRVTDKVVALMDAGVNPWRKPWETIGRIGGPRSISTGKGYRGINVFLLTLEAMDSGYDSPYWGTYKAITEAGGQVRKGEKASEIYLMSTFDSKTEVDAKGAPKKVWFLKSFAVFNARQADGLPGKYYPAPAAVGARPEFAAVEAAELVAKDYPHRVGLTVAHGGDRACYSPATDAIRVPDRAAFTRGAAEYYSTLFHEFGHSTGHADRLARKGVTDIDHFGSDQYSAEELVAELTSAMVCGTVGISAEVIENQAAYLAHWAGVLRGDSKLVVRAATAAHKAADLILGPADDDAS